MTKFKYQIELTFRGEELVKGNSSFNRENLEDEVLIQDFVIPYEEVTSVET